VERLRPRVRELDAVLVLPARRVSQEATAKLIIMKGQQAVVRAVADKLHEVASAAYCACLPSSQREPLMQAGATIF
jgi:formaldehyde-activating enzyme involved in methanogenesis